MNDDIPDHKLLHAFLTDCERIITMLVHDKGLLCVSLSCIAYALVRPSVRLNGNQNK